MTVYTLYVKTHKQTGLKYLGYTKSTNLDEYTGSGKYWTYHIQKHGYEVDTDILFKTTIKEEIKEKGLYYSNLWNIVESDDWANLKPELGDGGGNGSANKGKAPWNKGKDMSDYIKKDGEKYTPYNKGLTGLYQPPLSEESKEALSKLWKDKTRPKEHCDAMREGWQKRKEAGLSITPWNTGLTGLKGPCKKITLIDPNGNLLEYESMKQGCKENGLIYTKMSAVNNGKARQHHGWTILKPKHLPAK
jgi:hypothetical protein